MKLPEEVLQQLRAGLEGAVETGNVPGTTAVVFDKNGEELFAHAAGKRGLSSSEPMTLDSIYWIASCTKMLTGLSCMQLVEKGQLSLDDSDQLEKLCPELRDVQVLKEDGTLEPKRNRITLRMLLSHTAGFGYAFFNERLRDYGYPAGIDEFSGSMQDVQTPLTFHPGEGWQYGVSMNKYTNGYQLMSLTLLFLFFPRSTLTGPELPLSEQPA
jgi:CubicO group peptidase (beta-lactamase class C family)